MKKIPNTLKTISKFIKKGSSFNDKFFSISKAMKKKNKSKSNTF